MTALLKYDAACRALAEASTIDEVKDIRDKAEAMRLYARQAKNTELEERAAVIRLRGERRLGEMLADAKEAGQLRPGHPRKKNGSDSEPLERIKLEDYGIDKKLSSDAQRLAALSEEHFGSLELRIAESIRDRNVRAATSTLEKQQMRANRERILGACQSALPTKKFGVIVADPEWRFEPWSRATGMDRAADNHYPTSCTEVIAARDVPSIAAADCVLFLWATAPMLPHALLVMAAWGFDYKSQVIWQKCRPSGEPFLGTGYWFRNAHELLLVGVKGNIPAPAMGTQEPSIIEAPVGKHSEKPEDFLQMIEDYFPTLPKIELNRRGPARPGWSAWGFEAEQSPTENAAELMESPAASEPACASPSPQPQQAHAGSSLADDGGEIPTCLRVGHPDNAWRSALE